MMFKPLQEAHRWKWSRVRAPKLKSSLLDLVNGDGDWWSYILPSRWSFEDRSVVLFEAPERPGTCAAAGPSAARGAARNSWPLRMRVRPWGDRCRPREEGRRAPAGKLPPWRCKKGFHKYPTHPPAPKSGELFHRLNLLYLHNHLQTEIQVSCNQSFQRFVIECAINP